jgi:hypothetical protein
MTRQRRLGDFFPENRLGNQFSDAIEQKSEETFENFGMAGLLRLCAEFLALKEEGEELRACCEEIWYIYARSIGRIGGAGIKRLFVALCFSVGYFCFGHGVTEISVPLQH